MNQSITEESVFLNQISSSEDEASPSHKQSLIMDEISQTMSFSKHQELRMNDTVVLQCHADEISQKSTQNAKEAYQREIIKELVSKQKKRFKVDGFNLDLTYITDNLIAMGFPAENFEAIYRNPMQEVQKFLNTRHPNNYMVINLCTERKYSHDCFYNVREFPFDDHQAPPFNLMYEFCNVVHEWLAQNNNHVVAIHCKAGKGRTGVMVCCYLLYCGKYQSSKDALTFYGLVRTQNKQGVTIPSQIRYVEYFSYALKNDLLHKIPKEVEILEARVLGLTGSLLIRLQNNEKQLIEKPIIQNENAIIFTFQDVHLQGDVLIQIFQKSIMSETKILQAWFNTEFVSLTPKEQIFKTNQLDISKKVKHSNIQLELIFDNVIQTRGRSNCLSKKK